MNDIFAVFARIVNSCSRTLIIIPWSVCVSGLNYGRYCRSFACHMSVVTFCARTLISIRWSVCVRFELWTMLS